MSTLTLNRADVSRHTDGLGLLHDLREALKKRPSVPAQAGEIGSEIRLFEGTRLLATLEADGLRALRACLVAAIAADALAPAEAKRVAVLGSGLEASGALKALRLVRSLREVWLCGPSFPDTILEAAQLQLTLKTPVRSVERAAEAVANAELVLCTGGVQLPEVALWPSVHLSLPSAARFDTSPLPTGVLARAWRVSEGLGTVWNQPIQAELGAVLNGSAARPDGVNPLYAGTGPAWLDLVAAWHVYLGAQNDPSIHRA